MEPQKSSFINDEFDLGLAIAIFRKNIFWIIILPVLGFVIAYISLRYSKPVYESSAIVKLDDKNEMRNVIQYEDIYESNIIGEITRLKSLKLFENSTDHLPLNISYYTRGKFMNTENYRLSEFQIKHQIKDKAIFQVPINVEFVSNESAVVHYQIGDSIFSKITPLNQWVSLPVMELKLVVSPSVVSQLVGVGNKFYFVVNSREHVVNDNFRLLDVKAVDVNAKTIRVKFTGNSANKVADLANALAKQFLIFNVEKKKEGANKMISFTNDQINKIDARIRYYERLLEPYRILERSNGGVKLIGELIEKIKVEKVLTLKSLAELNDFKSVLESDITGAPFYAKIITVNDSKYLSSITGNLKSLLSLKRNKAFKVAETSYELKEIDFKIDLEKQDLRDIVSELILEQEKNLLEIERRKKGYLGVDGGAEGNFSFDKDYLHLLRMYEINRKYFEKLLTKKAEHEMVRSGYVADSEIIAAAKVPSESIYPNKFDFYLFLVGGGVALGLIIMLIKYLLHNTISSAKDIAKHPDILTLGMVPSYEGAMPVSQLLVNKNPKSLMSEAFRSIRSNLQFLSSDEGSKVIAVTSTVSGEGKTFVAMNLSGIIAFSEKKVVIIDLDLRKPKIHLGFNVQNAEGMSSVLIRKSELKDVIQKSSIANLDFITAGPIPPNPSELILSKKMVEVIEELKSNYDVVIIDNPPVGIVTDAFPILQSADYPVYVLRAGVSKKFFLNNISDLKTTEKIKNLSVILNGVENTSSYGYSYGYGYGYGYSSGYYEDVVEKKRTGLARLLRKE
ncbi:MAG: tyrosine-protein kinase Etk/Wzc [Glaciecola sp.]|jgi:tyrosine-protein kinase Etk/Wzc